MTLDQDPSSWNVLRTKSRHEKAVESLLESRRITVYLPKIIKSIHGSHRRTEVPLFPGYVFVQPRQDDIHGLRYIPGTCGLIMERGRPGLIRNRQIEAIRLLLSSNLMVDTHAGLLPGTRVRVTEGPLAGVEGFMICVKNRKRLVINADVLGQSVSVEINRCQVVPC